VPILLSLLLFFVATATHAETTARLLPVYPQAELQRPASEQHVDEYVLPLGAYQRAGGDWRLDDSERLSGSLQRFTYRIPDGHSPAEVQRFWLSQLQAVTSKILYSCRGRACGPSNQWANGVFGVSELYGLDEQQHYDALELESDGHRYTLALYTVQRGNRRVYAQLDLLALANADAVDLSITSNALLTQLRERGSVVLAILKGNETTPDEEQVDALVRALQKDSRLQLYVVGHAYGAQPLPALQQRAQGYADELVGQLRAQGIAAGRLQAHGVGPLAPAMRGQQDRIELVVRGR
jgi:hypothetical protein